MEFFYQNYLWGQYLKKLRKEQKNALKKLLYTNLYPAKKNPRKFIFTVKIFYKYAT